MRWISFCIHLHISSKLRLLICKWETGCGWGVYCNSCRLFHLKSFLGGRAEGGAGAGWVSQKRLRILFKVSFLPFFPLKPSAKIPWLVNVQLLSFTLVPHLATLLSPHHSSSHWNRRSSQPPACCENQWGRAVCIGAAWGPRGVPGAAGADTHAQRHGAGSSFVSPSSSKGQCQISPDPFERPRQTNHENQSAVAN